MNDKNNIDELFRDGLSNQKFEMNPAAWNQMESLIDAQQKKKRRGIIIFYSGLAASLFIVLGLAFFKHSTTTKSITSKNIEVISKNNIIETPKDTNITNDDKLFETSQEKPIITENKTENYNIDNQIVEKQKEVEINKQKDDVSLNVDEHKETPVALISTTDSIEFDYIAQVANDTSIMLPFSAKEKRQQRKHDEKLMLMQYKLAQLKVDENQANIDKRTENELKHNRPHKFNINIIGGVNVSQGFLNSDLSRATPSIDPTFGLGISYILNTLVSLDANVLYHQRGGLSQEQLPEIYVQPGTTEIAKSLQYIDVPFYINYRFKNRHAVRFGLQYSQLLSTKVEISGAQESITYKKQDYFANYDMAGIIGYKYLVNERFNIGIRGNFGLFDVTLGQQPLENTFDMNRQIRFLLEYKLLKN